MAGAEPPDPAELRIDYEAELVDPQEQVTVPAGTFAAVHVRIARHQHRDDSRSVQDLWFAPGTGLVRETVRGQGRLQVVELTAFRPGRLDPPQPQAVLARHLARDERGAQAAPRIEWSEPDDNTAALLHSRFARVTWSGEAPRLYRVLDDHAAPFDHSKAEDWNRLIADEHLAEFASSSDDFDFVQLTMLAARLEAEQRGLKGFKIKNSKLSIQGGPGREETMEAEVTGSATGTGNRAVELIAFLRAAGGRIDGDLRFTVNRP